jgi:Cytidylate kinase-like family
VGCRVVCISRTEGANARTVAGAVCDALGFRLVDEEVVAHAAVDAGVDQDVIADVERRKSAVAKIRNRFVASGVANSTDQFMTALDPVTAGTLGASLSGYARSVRLSADELRGLIRSAIDEIAASGNVVIVAHAASHALARREGVLRVLITASPATRSARLSESLEVDAKEADQAVKKSDHRPRRLLAPLLRNRQRAANSLRPRRQHRHAHGGRCRRDDRRSGEPPGVGLLLLAV